MATEAKFKVGDRVRRTGYSMWPREYGEVGKEYTVLQVDRAGNPIVIQGANGASPSDFELVAETWRPKVGDRVTANGNTNVNVEEHWNRCFRRSVGDIIDGALIVTSVADHSGGNIGLSNKAGRSHFFMPANTLKPAAPATFTIESGKYYKTRDGRKVGPMVKQDDYFYFSGWHYGVDGHCGYEGGDTLKFAERDLIAEWVDEPATQAPVANDNTLAKPKFKVGDRVVTSAVNDAGVGIVVEDSADGYCKVDFRDTWYRICTEKERNLSLAVDSSTTPAIVALIENGVAKPATKPKVHADQDSATIEAERLALAYPGQQFGVFVLADSKIADLVNVPTPVLRAA